MDESKTTGMTGNAVANDLNGIDRDRISYATIIQAAARIEALMPSGLAPIAPQAAVLIQTELFPGSYVWSVQVKV